MDFTAITTYYITTNVTAASSTPDYVGSMMENWNLGILVASTQTIIHFLD